MAYLDHAATTPMHPAAIEAMAAVQRTIGNASSLHTSGRSARRRIEEARELIADKLGARPSEVIFTAGGTESDNLAVKGIYWARRDAEPHRRRIVTTEVEHHAVLDSVNWLVEHEGAHVTWLPTAADGSVSATALREALQSHDDVALVSVMWANNEVGTILPIAEMSVVAMEFGVPMHSDAIQAVGQLPLDFGASGLSAMSVAGHKFGGPPGVGALLLRRDVTCVPLMHGGGQERDIRSGTPDVASAVGMATAAQIAVDGLEENSARLRLLRDRLVEGVLAEIDDVCLNGADDPMRLAGNAHFTFRGCEGDALLMLLDANGIECSTGSACTAGVAQPSHVLIAMGVDAASARGSLRLSLGHTSVEADVDAALEVLPGAVARARRAALAAAEHPDESSRRDERWRRLVCCCRPHGRCRTRGGRSAHGAIDRARHAAHRLAGLLFQRGRCRRAPRRRCARNPVLCLGFRREVQRGRDQRLRVVVCPRGNSEPLRAVQSADQVRCSVRQGCGVGFRYGGHRPLRPAVGWAAAPRRRPGQGSVLCACRAHCAAAAPRRVPDRRHAEAADPCRGGPPRPGGRQQAG